jgi:adenylate cyclase
VPLRQFPYGAPLDREFVAEPLKTIAAPAPRAIGVDLLFDQPTEEDKDKQLRQTLHSLTVPLVVSYVQIASVVSEDEKALLDARGLANLATVPFDVVRRVYPGAETKDG